MTEPPEEPEREREGAAEADLVQNRLHNLERIRRLADLYPFSYPATHVVAEITRRYDQTPGEELEKLATSADSGSRGQATNRRAGASSFTGRYLIGSRRKRTATDAGSMATISPSSTS